MKKQEEIAKLINGKRKEADQFIQKVNNALSERTSISKIAYVLRKLPAEKRTLDNVLIMLGGQPEPSQTQSPLSNIPPKLKITATTHSPERISGSIKSPQFKTDWCEFEKIIQTHNVTCLYHFTDEANLPSIIERGGLYSWHYCTVAGIEVLRPGGNDLSRKLDVQHGLQDYVRIGFNSNPPMLYKVIESGYVINPVILEINPVVIYWESTLFSNINATDNLATVGGDLASFKNIRFDVAIRRYWEGELQKKLRQAEVLVKTHISLDLIRIP